MVPVLLSMLVLAGCAGPPDPAGWTPTVPGPDWPDEAGAPLPLPADLADHAWLGDVSRYGQRGTPTGRGEAGSWAVGNGRVFGLIGLDDPWNTLTNALGPGYQVRGGFFGDASVHLAAGPFDHEVVQRPRGTAVVRTMGRTGDLVLTTTDFAPAGHDAIVRHLAVRNEGDTEAAPDLVLRLARTSDEPVVDDPRGLVQVRGERRMLLACPGEQLALARSSLTIDLAPLAAGAEVAVTCVHAFGRGEVPDPPELDVHAALEATREAPADLLARAVELDVPDPKVADLVEGMLITQWVQTAPIGAVSPMSRYTKGWLRDTEGPVRLYLAAGLPDEARTLLDTLYRVAVVQGATTNSFALDTDLSGFEEPADPTAFWEEAAFMPGRDPVEAPSYPVWLHAAWVRHTGDQALLDPGRMAWLEHCLRRQEDTDGLMAFSGDETFRFALAFAVGGGMPENVGWSSNSAFWFVSAADALTALGGDPVLGDRADAVRATTDATYRIDGTYSPLAYADSGEPWPHPFEDVTPMPLWTGYLPPDDPVAHSTVQSLVDDLMREDGTLLTPEPAGGDQMPLYTGMVPGFFLYALARTGHPEGERAFEALDRVATPSGHFAEGHTPDHAAWSLVHDPTGLGGDVAARYRPWEGGDVAAAALAYLVGAHPDALGRTLTLAPHLPRGWPALGAYGLRLGDGTWDLEIDGYQEGRVVRITRVGGAHPWTVDLDLPGHERAWVDGERSDPAAPSFEVAPGEQVVVVAE